MEVDETMIRTILLWLVFVMIVLEIPYRIYQVAEGEHEHKQDPGAHAIGAVMDTIFAFLWWLYVLH